MGRKPMSRWPRVILAMTHSTGSHGNPHRNVGHPTERLKDSSTHKVDAVSSAERRLLERITAAQQHRRHRDPSRHHQHHHHDDDDDDSHADPATTPTNTPHRRKSSPSLAPCSHSQQTNEHPSQKRTKGTNSPRNRRNRIGRSKRSQISLVSLVTGHDRFTNRDHRLRTPSTSSSSSTLSDDGDDNVSEGDSVNSRTSSSSCCSNTSVASQNLCVSGTGSSSADSLCIDTDDCSLVTEVDQDLDYTTESSKSLDLEDFDLDGSVASPSSSSSVIVPETKSVSFGTVSVRVYPQILGDHPCCTSGCPLTLDWKHIDEQETTVNQFEQVCPPLTLETSQPTAEGSKIPSTAVPYRSSSTSSATVTNSTSLRLSYEQRYAIVTANDSLSAQELRRQCRRQNRECQGWTSKCRRSQQRHLSKAFFFADDAKGNVAHPRQLTGDLHKTGKARPSAQ